VRHQAFVEEEGQARSRQHLMSHAVASTATEEKSNSPLMRELGTIDATMIVIGSMIGSGIFIVSAESGRLVGAPGWLLLAWGLSGLMTVSGSIAAAEIAAMMPRVGGQYVFLREAYRPMFGFLFGWAMFLVVQTGTIAAVSVAFAKFLGVFIPQIAADNYLVAPKDLGGYAFSLSTQQIVAIALIVLLTAVNMQGLKLGKWIQNTFTFTKTAALVGLIVVGLLLGSNFASAAWTSWWWYPAANGWDSSAAYKGLPVEGWGAMPLLLGLAMIGPLFAQSAWNNVTFTGGEVRDPGRTFPRAMIIGTFSVVVLYLLANVAYIVTLSWPDIQHAPQDRVGTAAMHAILGPPGAAIMAIAILISTFGCVNGLVLAGARVYYAMACDGLFFRGVASTNRHHVPAIALVAQGIWASLLVLPVTVSVDVASGLTKYGNLYGELLEYIIPVDVTFYTLMVGAVVAFRRKEPGLARPYRTIAYPLPAIIYIGLALFLIVDFIYLKPRTSGIGYLIVLAGIPVYLVWSRLAKWREGPGGNRNLDALR
jgi:APA family basic amino acid/polyamine antiporter